MASRVDNSVLDHSESPFFDEAAMRAVKSEGFYQEHRSQRARGAQGNQHERGVQNAHVCYAGEIYAKGD